MKSSKSKKFNKKYAVEIHDLHKTKNSIMAHRTEEKIKTIFETSTRNGLIQRIILLNENHKPIWGKMNVFQMLKHNTYWNRWILGKDSHTYKQTFMGKIFGKIELKRMIKEMTKEQA